MNNSSWSAFRINRIKMLNINIKSVEVLKFLKIVSGSHPGPAFSKQAKTGP
jgi:hypothetical protein